jgi:hypothetical protein
MRFSYRIDRQAAINLWRQAISTCDGIVTMRTVQEFAALVDEAARKHCAQEVDPKPPLRPSDDAWVTLEQAAARIREGKDFSRG